MSEPECISVDELIPDVQSRLTAGQPDQVTEYLNRTRIRPESLTPYLHSHDAHYTRNLIFKSEQVELLALCWGVGHRSWIHNHRGRHCWMAVIEGTLGVRNYKRLGCDQQWRTVGLEPTSEFLVSPGSLAKVDPTEPIHLVWNPAELNQPAVSLHIYSLPFDTCVVYDAEQGLCRDVALFYTSEYGVRTDQHQGGKQLTSLPACACTLTPMEQDAHCGATAQSAKAQVPLIR